MTVDHETQLLAALAILERAETPEEARAAAALIEGGGDDE